MSELSYAPLSTYAEVVMGQSPGADLCNSEEKGLPFLQGCAEFGARYPTAAIYCNPPLRIAKSGSVLMSVRAPVGTMNFADQDYCIGRGLGAFKAKAGASNTVFLKHAVELNAAYLHRRSQGSTFAAVSTDDVRSVPVPVFDVAKQEKLAHIFISIDTAIEKTEALIDKYQQIKAGLMHDLFTRGVLPNGQLRPPREQEPELYQETSIGWIPREWEPIRLGEVVDFWDGRRVPLKEEDRAKIPGQIPYYGASGVIDWIDRWLFDDELILLGEDGENIVSRNLPLVFKVSGKCWVNNHAHILKTKPGQNIDFWVEQLEWRDYSTMTSGSAQPKITQTQLSRMIVTVPRESEQAQVAEIAVRFKERMEQERKQMEKLRQQKLGLMQDLLTGKVPVKVGAGGTAHG